MVMRIDAQIEVTAMHSMDGKIVGFAKFFILVQYSIAEKLPQFKVMETIKDLLASESEKGKDKFEYVSFKIKNELPKQLSTLEFFANINKRMEDSND